MNIKPTSIQLFKESLFTFYDNPEYHGATGLLEMAPFGFDTTYQKPLDRIGTITNGKPPKTAKDVQSAITAYADFLDDFQEIVANCTLPLKTYKVPVLFTEKWNIIKTIKQETLKKFNQEFKLQSDTLDLKTLKGTQKKRYQEISNEIKSHYLSNNMANIPKTDFTVTQWHLDMIRLIVWELWINHANERLSTEVNGDIENDEFTEVAYKDLDTLMKALHKTASVHFPMIANSAKRPFGSYTQYYLELAEAGFKNVVINDDGDVDNETEEKMDQCYQELHTALLCMAWYGKIEQKPKPKVVEEVVEELTRDDYRLETIEACIKEKNPELSIHFNYDPVDNDLFEEKFKQCTHLEKLDITTKNIKMLQGLKNLKELKLRFKTEIGEIQDLSPLRHIPNLKRLDISYSKGTDSSALAALIQLEYLSIGNVTNLDFLGSLKQLRELELSIHGEEHKEDEIKNLTPLGSLENLTSLRILGNKYRSLDTKKLKSLTEMIGKLTNLESLTLSNNHIADISSFSGLNKLTKFHIEEEEKISRDLSVLKNMPKLEYLYAKTRGAVKDLKVIASLKELKHFNVKFQNEKPVDITPLCEATQLETIIIRDVSVKEIPKQKRKLKHLKAFQLSGGYNNYERITHIKPLAQLTTLEKLNLHSNGLEKIADLAPLLELEKLETLSLWRNSVCNLLPKKFDRGGNYHWDEVKGGISKKSIEELKEIIRMDQIKRSRNNNKKINL